MIFMKFIMNILFLDFVERFNISVILVNNIVILQICVMYEVLFEGFVEYNILFLQKCKGLMLISFGDFSLCCIVLDVIEIIQDVFGNDMRL